MGQEQSQRAKHLLGDAVGGQEVLAPTHPALTLHLQGGRALSIVGITHVHALVPKLTSVNDETPAGPLGPHAHRLAPPQLHTVLWRNEARLSAGTAQQSGPIPAHPW